MGRRSHGREVNGVLLLNKESGMTSNKALQQAKRLFFASKAGHTGSLDPLATGVLPVCFGEATKFSQYLLNADKRYRSTFQLGVTTATGDADGEVISDMPVSGLDEARVERALSKFQGEIEQVPSMYSALKYQGQPLYKLARQGKTVVREPRQVTIYSLKLLAFRPGAAAEVDVEVHCSKGTYIRSIAEDLGRELGCGAHVKTLHRASAGPFEEQRAVSLETLEEERGQQQACVLDHYLLPVDTPVSHLPELILPESVGFYFLRGQPVMEARSYRLGGEGDMVRVFQKSQEGETGFLGVGAIMEDGKISPKRLTVKPI